LGELQGEASGWLTVALLNVLLSRLDSSWLDEASFIAITSLVVGVEKDDIKGGKLSTAFAENQNW